MKTKASLPVRILTHNIRYAANPPSAGEKPWSIRKQLIFDELHYHTLYNAESFICLQEVLNEQLLDIMSSLGKKWDYIGVGRDDGKQAGEYGPIIYRKEIWELKNWQTVWLNEDGAVGKKGWDAGCVRIITIGTFKHVESKQGLVAMCTHLDNSGTVSRRESAKTILNVLKSVTCANSTAGAQNMPCFLAGDLNSKPKGEAYQILNGKESSLRDAKELTKWNYGNHYTFTDFKGQDLELIDFVFLGLKEAGQWDVEGHSILDNRFDDGVYGSDHRAVVVDAVLTI